MFIEILIFAIIIGYIIGGRLKNFNNVDIKGVWMVFLALAIETVMIILIRKEIIIRSLATYIINLLMYVLICFFAYFNRKDKWILLMCLGFILNAIAIFSNGGSMPVSLSAAKKAGLPMDMEKEGLYRLIDENTRLWFLGDVIPLTFLRNFAISLGDIVIGLGLFGFIITSMKKSIKAK